MDRCNCAVSRPLNVGGSVEVRYVGHESSCAIYDMCVWCESNMGSQLGEIHEQCKPLFKVAIMALQRWAELRMK